MRIAVCDDDPMLLMDAKNRIEQYFDGKNFILSVFNSARDFTEFIENDNAVDIVIMDIELENNISGIDVIKSLSNKLRHTKVIYLTGYVEYVSSVYETAHEYFVLKTATDEYFNKALDKAIASINAQKSALYINSRFCKAVVETNSIIYIERDKRTSHIICEDDKYETSEKLEALLDRLNGDKFIRCHTSYIINADKIKQYKDNAFTMVNNESVKVTRTYKKSVEKAFFDYIKNRLVTN